MNKKYNEMASYFTHIYQSSRIAKYCLQDLLADGDITPEQYAEFMKAAILFHKDLTDIVRKKLNKLFIED